MNKRKLFNAKFLRLSFRRQKKAIIAHMQMCVKDELFRILSNKVPVKNDETTRADMVDSIRRVLLEFDVESAKAWQRNLVINIQGAPEVKIEVPTITFVK